MRIVLDKPIAPSTNESAPTYPETENNNNNSFIDLIMADVINSDVAITAEQITQSAETVQDIDINALDKLLTQLQQNVLPNNSITPQISEITLEKTSEQVTASVDGEIVDVTAEGAKQNLISNDTVTKDEAATAAVEKTDTGNINNNKNQKTIRSNLSASAKASINNSNSANTNSETSNNNVSAETVKSDTQSIALNKSNENVSKNQINEITTKNAIMNSFTSHAMQRAVSTTKSSSATNFANEMLSANVAFHFENIDQIKEKALGTGTHHININITPPELGPISARLKMSAENRVELDILAKNNDVAQVIKSQIHALREQFSNSDIRLDGINVQTDDSLSENNSNKDSDYNQTFPVDYLNSPIDSANVIKTKEKIQKNKETLIDAYI